nr:DUF6261 family protein [uncultured Carboxylicivirga sp.]
MIQKIISSTKNTETDAISNGIIDAYQSSGLDTDAYLTALFAKIVPLSNELTGAIRRTKKESELQEKDVVRDNAIRAFYYIVTGLSYHHDLAVRQASLQIMNVFDKYGLKIISESYATESSLINSLLMDLASDDNKAAIALLGMAMSMVDGIKAAQDDFEQTEIAYRQQQGQEATYENASGVKSQLIKIINNELIVYLRAMEAVAEDTYGDLCRTVAKIIAENNEVVKKRKNKTLEESV